MLNPDLKLNENLFTDTVEMKPTRDGFGEGRAGERERSSLARHRRLERRKHDAFIIPFLAGFKNYAERAVGQLGHV